MNYNLTSAFKSEILKNTRENDPWPELLLSKIRLTRKEPAARLKIALCQFSFLPKCPKIRPVDSYDSVFNGIHTLLVLFSH